ncbi:MAG: hypothetical protein AABO41_28310 [Acidobacteriota bacterium]
MKNLLLGLGVIGLIPGAWFVYRYLYPDGAADKQDAVIGGVLLAVALICFAVFFFMKFREEGEQDISITKF